MQKLISVMLAILFSISGMFGVIFGQPSAQALNFQGVNVSVSSVLAQAEGYKYRNDADKKLEQIGNKIDLNNSSILEFRRLRGFYPTLARKIIQNAPYEKVEDVLEMPDLSESQRERIKQNLNEFVVTEPEGAFVQGQDRINNFVY